MLSERGSRCALACGLGYQLVIYLRIRLAGGLGTLKRAFIGVEKPSRPYFSKNES